jgi:mitochondrial mRNA pseudouridine synthase TRUB2
VTGKFGMSTETHFVDSPVTVRGSFDHITLNKLSSLLASLQSSHQKKMYELCGVDLQSQAAYELAAQGPIRPYKAKIPVIYSLRCIEYKKPYFTIGKVYQPQISFYKIKEIMNCFFSQKFTR